jgi:hypothetical protein
MKKMMFVFILICAFCFADENESGLSIVPMVNYEFVSLENRQYHSSGGGLTVLNGDWDISISEKYDTLMIGAFYKSYILSDFMPDYSKIYHDIAFIVERRIDTHLIQGIFRTNSDEPVYGGIHTTYSSIGYGYELIRKENVNFTLGLALGTSDFDIILPNGFSWPLFPSPIIRFGLNTSIINLSIDWPELTITLAPEYRFQMTGAVRLDFYGFNDVNDLTFNSILWYRLFSKYSKLGDFAGVGLGIKNDGIDFALGEKGKKYDINNYSIFGILDASFIKISSGYIFYNRVLYDKSHTSNDNRGFFVKVELLYKF